MMCCAVVCRVICGVLCPQGYTSSSSTRSGTICRTSTRFSSILGRLEVQRQLEQQPGPSRSLQDLLAQLEVCVRCLGSCVFVCGMFQLW